MNVRERVEKFARNVEAYCAANNAQMDSNEAPRFFPAGSSSDEHPIVIELYRRELILLRLEITSMKEDLPLLSRLFWIDEVISEFASRVAKILRRPTPVLPPATADADLQHTADVVIADNTYVRRIRTRADFDDLFDAIVVDKYIDPRLLALMPSNDSGVMPVFAEIRIDLATGKCVWRKAFSSGADNAERPPVRVSDDNASVNSRAWVSFLRPGSKNLDQIFRKIPRGHIQQWDNPVNNKRWYIVVIKPVDDVVGGGASGAVGGEEAAPKKRLHSETM